MLQEKQPPLVDSLDPEGRPLRRRRGNDADPLTHPLRGTAAQARPIMVATVGCHCWPIPWRATLRRSREATLASVHRRLRGTAALQAFTDDHRHERGRLLADHLELEGVRSVGAVETMQIPSGNRCEGPQTFQVFMEEWNVGESPARRRFAQL